MSRSASDEESSFTYGESMWISSVVRWGDPLQRILLELGLYQDTVNELIDPTKGCIYAAYGYQPGQFGERTRGVSKRSTRAVSRILSPEPPVLFPRQV